MKKKGQIEYSGISPFWNARFELIHKSIQDPERKQKFREMNLEKKKRVVGKLITGGKMI